MTAPDVSIVLPTLNRSGFLRHALRSALSQLHVDVEVIVVDDGSAAGCGEIVQSFRDARLRLITHAGTRGVSEARNTGIIAAQAAWVAFLDDDDLLAPDDLSAHLGAIRRRSGTAWSCVGSIHIDAATRVVGRSVPPDPARVQGDLARWNVIPAPSCVVAARQALRAVGLFDPAFACHADWDLWIRLSRWGGLATINRPLAAYRFHDQNMSADTELWDLERNRLQEKHLLPVDRSSTRLGGGSRGRAEAWNYFRAGRPSRAVKELSVLARQRLDWRAAALAAAIATVPSAVRRLDAARASRDVPDDWRLEAEDWLERLVSEEPSGLAARNAPLRDEHTS